MPKNQANPPNGWTFICFTLDRHCLRRYHRSTILFGDNQAENISTAESGSQLPVEEIPEQPSKVDIAGERVGKQIDDFTQQASSRFGEWINVKIFAGITWLKLILSLLLLFVVLLVERIVRLIIDRKRRKAEEEQEANKIKYLALQAVAKPLSMFIWVYGIYIVLTPLFAHFRRPDGTNLVYTVAQKAADLGAAIAVIWFIFMLVSMIGVLILW